MRNSFAYLLGGQYKEEETELEINLKSCVPFFIAYPETITNPNYHLEDIVPYYHSQFNYNDPSEFVDIATLNAPKEGQKFKDVFGKRDYSNNKVLGNLFLNLMRTVVFNSISGTSQSMNTPKLSVIIDIGSLSSRKDKIEISKQDIANFDTLKTGLIAFTDHLTVNSKELTDTQKSNILLLNELNVSFNDLGTTGGR